MTHSRTWIPVTLIACLFIVAGMGEVAARSAEAVFGGKIFILKKRPPSYFNSKNGFVSFIRNNSTKTVHENNEKTWVFETMAFFKRPLGDYEVEMMFYDIEGGKSKNARRFVNSYTQYTQDRNARSLSGKTELVRPHFDANTRYLIIAQSHGKEVATGEFATRGTSQAAIDSQKRYEHTQKEMEKSMKDLERRAKEQEEREKKNKNASDSLF